MSASFGPCSDWPVYFTCDISTYSPAATGYAVTSATRVLWALSGRRYGTCQVTLRPCKQECFSEYVGWNQWFGYPVADFGWTANWWLNAACGAGSCWDTCSCTQLAQVLLPTPVNTIVQVKVDGTPLVTGAYRVDDNRFLVRTDGGTWPRCNNLNLADTQVGTWSVTATYGEDVPDSARFAMGELACEILRATAGQDCSLPPTIRSLVRQGVAIDFSSSRDLLTEGRTGLYLVDLFLAAENPHRLTQRPRVYSVDRHPSRRAGT